MSDFKPAVTLKTHDQAVVTVAMAAGEFALLNVIGANQNVQVFWLVMVWLAFFLGLVISNMKKKEDGTWVNPMTGLLTAIPLLFLGPARSLTVLYALFLWLLV